MFNHELEVLGHTEELKVVGNYGCDAFGDCVTAGYLDGKNVLVIVQGTTFTLLKWRTDCYDEVRGKRISRSLGVPYLGEPLGKRFVPWLNFRSVDEGIEILSSFDATGLVGRVLRRA